MKNRILWIFDSAESVADLPKTEPARVNESPTSFDLPWVMFGPVGAQQKADAEENQGADEDVSVKEIHEELARFERLLDGLELPSFTE